MAKIACTPTSIRLESCYLYSQYANWDKYGTLSHAYFSADHSKETLQGTYYSN